MSRYISIWNSRCFAETFCGGEIRRRWNDPSSRNTKMRISKGNREIGAARRIFQGELSIRACCRPEQVIGFHFTYFITWMYSIFLRNVYDSKSHHIQCYKCPLCPVISYFHSAREVILPSHFSGLFNNNRAYKWRASRLA